MADPTYEDVYEPPILDSTGQAIAGAIQGLNPPVPAFISDAFSVERSYSAGDIVIYENKVYIFTSSKSAGAWDSTKVRETTIGAICTATNNSLTQKQNRYIDGTNSTSYTIPISAINQNHSFGVALVGAWKELYLLFFVAEANNCTITKLSNASGQTCSISNTTTDITLTFSSTVWAGITVMPL